MPETTIIKDIFRAADILKNGGLVAVPTETVYGLAANGLDSKAVARIYEAKGRPAEKAVSLMVAGAEWIDRLCVSVPEEAYALARKFWPGPLTLVLPASPEIPDIVTAGSGTVGLRCPDHPMTLELIKRCGFPLAAPSANLSGEPSPKSAREVYAALGGGIDCILDGGICAIGLESTIVDLTVSPPRILRQGGLPREVIEEETGPLEPDADGLDRLTVVGVTGPTGSGKTTALGVLEELGALVIDCDEVYHRLLRDDAELRNEITSRFGSTTLAPDGGIDRKALGNIVFADPRAMDDLNAITLRFMDGEVLRLLRGHVQRGGTLAAIDAIALIESGISSRCNVVVGIIAAAGLRAERIVRREGISMDYALLRISAQQNNSFYRENCDVVLENDGDAEAFIRKCRVCFDEIIK